MKNLLHARRKLQCYLSTVLIVFSRLQLFGGRSLVYRLCWYDGKGTSLSILCQVFALSATFGQPSSCVLFQSCAEGEEEVEEEGKEKTFEVKLLSPTLRPRTWSFESCGEWLSVSSCRKRKWRSRRCCISKPGCTTEALQRWCCRWSVPAKVGLAQNALFF